MEATIDQGCADGVASRAEGANLTAVLEDWRLDEFGQPTNPSGWGIALLTPHGGYMTLPTWMAEKIVAALSYNAQDQADAA